MLHPNPWDFVSVIFQKLPRVNDYSMKLELRILAATIS
jgi:hypothetical protein